MPKSTNSPSTLSDQFSPYSIKKFNSKLHKLTAANFKIKDSNKTLADLHPINVNEKEFCFSGLFFIDSKDNVCMKIKNTLIPDGPSLIVDLEEKDQTIYNTNDLLIIQDAIFLKTIDESNTHLKLIIPQTTKYINSNRVTVPIFTIDQVLDYEIEDLGNTKGKLVLLEDIKIKNANELFNDILADFNSLLYEDKLNRKKHLRIPNVILMKDCEDANEQELDITAFESSTTSLCPYLKASTQQILDGKVIDGNLKREDIINNIHDSLNSTFNITITIKKNQFKNNVLKQIHATKFEQVNRNKKIKLEINEN